MTLRRLAPLAFVLLIALPIHAQQAGAGLRALVGRTFNARVTSIVDGDTVHVRMDDGREVIVRLDGIDCPETGQPFSTQARNATRVRLFDQRVEVRGTDVDRYGRLVARVVAGGIDSSLELVKAGLACHFTQYSSDRTLAAAQVEAKTTGRGFWAPGGERPPACSVEAASAAHAATGPFHGNTSSHVYHSASCSNYRCGNCTAVFQTEADAKRAGFRPAGDCIGR